jgi:hypothetical protein
MAAATLAPGISRKLKKVLETRTDSPELLASLATLSTFYGENTLHARRALRTTIERRGLTINEEFLQASEAAQKVTFVGAFHSLGQDQSVLDNPRIHCATTKRDTSGHSAKLC